MKNTDRITPEILTPLQTKRGKAINYAAYVALGIAALGVSIFLFWSFQPDDVLQVNNSPFPVRTIREHPTADGVVILNVDFCKTTEVTGEVRTSFVSESKETFLPVGEEKGPTGCTKTEVPILIPTDIASGEYKIKFRAEYRINPIKEVVEEFETSMFTIDPKE